MASEITFLGERMKAGLLLKEFEKKREKGWIQGTLSLLYIRYYLDIQVRTLMRQNFTETTSP